MSKQRKSHMRPDVLNDFDYHPKKRRTAKQKREHAAKERQRYGLLKLGLEAAITMANGQGSPTCAICDKSSLTYEIDHVHFSTFRQRKMNSVQRLERFAIEFVKWMGGDEKYELRLACRKCNAKHQPKR